MIKQVITLLAASTVLSACLPAVNDQVTDMASPNQKLISSIKTTDSYEDIADAAVYSTDNGEFLIASLEGDGLAIFNSKGEQVFHDEHIETLGVDVRYGFNLGSAKTDLLAVGLPDDKSVRFYSLGEQAALSLVGEFKLDVEPAAVCFYKNVTTAQSSVTVVEENGLVSQYKLNLTGNQVTSALTEAGYAVPVRRFDVGGELSGCAIDDQNRNLYLAEQNVGLWIYGADIENVKDRKLLDAASPLGNIEEIEAIDLSYFAGNQNILWVADEGKGLLAYDLSDYSYLTTFSVEGFDEVKSVNASINGLWLGNTELSDPIYEFVAFDDISMVEKSAVHPAQLSQTELKLIAPSAETEAVDDDGDAADDSAFWFNVDDPKSSLIVATNKQAGLMVYNLQGKELQYLEEGEPNNVDLRPLTSGGALVASSNRDGNSIDLHFLNPESLALVPVEISGASANESGTGIQSALNEIYGLCIYQASNDELYVFANGKSGRIEQWKVNYGANTSAQLVRELQVASQPEGCVVDDATAELFLGEEDEGIWLFDANANGASQGELIIKIDGESLVADVEGLALYSSNNQQWLVASSQGNNSYSVYDRAENNRYLGSFAITENSALAIDGASDTDGIEIYSGYINEQFPSGIFIAQDWYNIDDEYQVENQNFKMVSWEAIQNEF